MALIKQVKVSGVTYDISMTAGKGIKINSSGFIEAELGSGLYFGESGEICATGFIAGVSSGLVQNLVGVLELNVGSGLTTKNGLLELNIGSGLVLNSNGELDIRA